MLYVDARNVVRALCGVRCGFKSMMWFLDVDFVREYRERKRREVLDEGGEVDVQCRIGM